MLGRGWFLILLALLFAAPAAAQRQTEQRLLLRPTRVFDGVDPAAHEGWQALVRGDRIEAVRPGLLADPTRDIRAVRSIRLVVKGGAVVREEPR